MNKLSRNVYIVIGWKGEAALLGITILSEFVKACFPKLFVGLRVKPRILKGPHHFFTAWLFFECMAYTRVPKLPHSVATLLHCYEGGLGEGKGGGGICPKYPMLDPPMRYNQYTSIFY